VGQHSHVHVGQHSLFMGGEGGGGGRRGGG
jgi:hypothetical protein